MELYSHNQSPSYPWRISRGFLNEAVPESNQRFHQHKNITKYVSTNFTRGFHFSPAIKSQIAQFMMSYIAITDNHKNQIPPEPPQIINPQNQDIEIFHDEILTDIIAQTDLNPYEFFLELQVMESPRYTSKFGMLEIAKEAKWEKIRCLGNILMLLENLAIILHKVILEHGGNFKNLGLFPKNPWQTTISPLFLNKSRQLMRLPQFIVSCKLFL
ncbi:hypothetical protein VP01_275g5 [Puccinia sorghi]|uniref:Uncharacterized protein n=1 Tax=Puccinia sorghi TaxID=27349 RepID=A0A0L6V3K6_9BASI|nr:hypothetical protein VP01_275g5 [Puccinia sorghi]